MDVCTSQPYSAADSRSIYDSDLSNQFSRPIRLPLREGGLDSWLPEYDRLYQGDYQRILKKFGAPFRFKEK